MKKVNKLMLPVYLYTTLTSLAFFTPIWILFFQSRGLSLTEIGMFVSAIFLTNFLLEYPSGIFADKFGRKNSLAAGITMDIILYLIIIFSTNFYHIIIAGLFIGASHSFVSGALEAYIYDSLKSKKMQKHNSYVLGRKDIFFGIGGMFAAAIGSILYNIKDILPYVATLAVYVIALLFTLRMKEPKLYKKQDIDMWSHFKLGVKNVLHNKTILTLLLMYIPLFLFNDAWVNAWQPIVVGLGLPIALLGTYTAIKIISFSFSGYFLPKLLKFNNKKIMIGIILAQAITWLLLGTNNLYIVIVSSYMLIIARSMWNYLDADIVHKHIKSNIRATTLSARQMMISIVWIFNPTFMGYLMNNFNRTLLFSIFGVILLIVSLGIFTFRQKYL